MVLKQIFTNGVHAHMNIGNSYSVITPNQSPEVFKQKAREQLPNLDGPPPEDIAAFLVCNQGDTKQTYTLYTGNYNAIKSDSGAIYEVITLMPE